jgi:putative copper resistance protein D
MAWELWRGLARGLSMAGFYGVFGTACLSATLLRGQPVRLGRLIALSLGLALLASAAWFLLQTQDFASATNWPDELAALPIVANDTRFGLLTLGRCTALLAAAALWCLSARRAACLVGLAAVAAESWLGHGGSMSGTVGAVLLVTSLAHLAAGGVWLGALPAFALALRRLGDAEAAALARGFSPIGIACVVLLLITAGIQYVILIWRPGSLVTTAYGLAASAKILGFAALIGIAAGNRAIARRLPADPGRLRARIAIEIALGLAVLIAAGLITQFEPPTMARMSLSSHPPGDLAQGLESRFGEQIALHQIDA